ncbi:hypothetical protein FQN57_002110 [Myotisia sp. PD_48]|nr:hypothetical protein FQN57_002110 [Myotisia sp. PD_48]
MGEGKTSVIIPLVLLNLARGNGLVRLIVLKPLLRQSLNLLSYRLGRLNNRSIYYIPFSRKIIVDNRAMDTSQELYQQCRQSLGILLALSEHILSFRLASIERHLKEPQIAQQMLKLENMLKLTCRDVVDESDEVLHSRFQLVYAMGNQETINGGRQRWEIHQAVLSMVEEEANLLQQYDPSGLELMRHGRIGVSFPVINFLRPETMDKLIEGVLKCIEKGKLSGAPFNPGKPHVRKSAMNFISTHAVSTSDQDTIEESFGTEDLFNRLLTLRGLFAYNILAFVLRSKHWRVEYGTHPHRCMMAVPYRAKDVPAENSEFGHIDVAILFTCMSYYYQALSSDQVRDCFSLLFKENDAASEYQSWISKEKELLPVGLREYTGVNLEDKTTFEDRLYPHLQHQKSLIDFYLSRVVFPPEANQFPKRLSMSSWDIPSQSRDRLTVGFSGTNDNKFMLPLSIEQNDLPYLLHTNAMVLSTILRKENRTCVLAQDALGNQLGNRELLSLLSSLEPNVRVLIDVGAQVLEDNHAVAVEWLKIIPDVDAAVYYNNQDDIVVMDRNGHVESLAASSFQDRLGNCLVYLDQHHSRGVDLKFPSDSRAAVTLGPRLTKDRLIQACNRLRKLGSGQSIVFVAPPQVRNKMRELSEDFGRREFDSTGSTLGVSRAGILLTAALEESLASGGDFNDIVSRMQVSEALTLSEAYGPQETQSLLYDALRDIGDQRDVVSQKLLAALQEMDPIDHGGQSLNEEQERELTHEVQTERQVERPLAVEPLPHELDPDRLYYAENRSFCNDVQPPCSLLAFDSFLRTSARSLFPSMSAPQFFVTKDFQLTIKPLGTNSHYDEYIKPVSWVLTSTHNSSIVVISQYEANSLHLIVRKSRNTTIHLYSPKVTRTMTSFRDLKFLSVGQQVFAQLPPQLPINELELFASSLYFESFAIYREFCGFLGFISDQVTESDDMNVSTKKGFINGEGREQLGWTVHCPFKTYPLSFVRRLVAIQRRGQSSQRSHMASILDGRALTEKGFDI